MIYLDKIYINSARNDVYILTYSLRRPWLSSCADNGWCWHGDRRLPWSDLQAEALSDVLRVRLERNRNIPPTNVLVHRIVTICVTQPRFATRNFQLVAVSQIEVHWELETVCFRVLDFLRAVTVVLVGNGLARKTGTQVIFIRVNCERDHLTKLHSGVVVTATHTWTWSSDKLWLKTFRFNFVTGTKFQRKKSRCNNKIGN